MYICIFFVWRCWASAKTCFSPRRWNALGASGRFPRAIRTLLLCQQDYDVMTSPPPYILEISLTSDNFENDQRPCIRHAFPRAPLHPTRPPTRMRVTTLWVHVYICVPTTTTDAFSKILFSINDRVVKYVVLPSCDSLGRAIKTICISVAVRFPSARYVFPSPKNIVYSARIDLTAEMKAIRNFFAYISSSRGKTISTRRWFFVETTVVLIKISASNVTKYN